MAGFMEFRSGEWTIKAMYACLAVAAVGWGMTAYKAINSSSSISGGKTSLMCASCKHKIEITREEFNQMQKERNEKYIDEVAKTNPQSAMQMREYLDNPASAPMMPGLFPPWGTVNAPLTCPQCGEDTFITARKCEKCGEIYLPYDENWQWDDKCPKCGFSKRENDKKEKEQERDAKRQKREEKRNK
ncbi:MAG: hypothetical protein JW860_02805 [Sedimentisphaerales bacterium]|nr:hypothetical protein [Sedimentisphaerales bacterium]